jgi:YegS/Rv2252/BmrU family lipid kinase
MLAPRPVPREAVLVVNVHSRKGRDLFRDAQALLREAGVHLIAAHAVRDPRRLRQMVNQAVADGAAMVIVGGGDGSLSCTVDFVVDRDCVFALLPLGTANSFARTLGIPLDLEGAVDAIANGRLRRIDLGVINGDYFANGAAMGLAPMIADSVPHRLKKYLGRVGYLVWAIWCLIRFRPFTARIDDGETSHSLTALELRIINGRFHGGVEVAETTDVDSGDIVIQAILGHYRWKLVWNWFATYFRLAARHETMEEFRGKKMEMVTRPPLRISIDGEVLGKTPAIVEVAEKAIEVVVPAKG